MFHECVDISHIFGYLSGWPFWKHLLQWFHLQSGQNQVCRWVTSHRSQRPRGSVFESTVILVSWRTVLTGQSMNISSIDVRSMLPENLNHFFRYQGSLTTPPCYESILWTVFDTPITLSHNQVRRSLKSKSSVMHVLQPDCNHFKETSLVYMVMCSDQEAGEYTDGHRQQDPVERLPHGSASKWPCGGVFFPATPRERKCVTSCDIVIAYNMQYPLFLTIIVEHNQDLRPNVIIFVYLLFFSAFCRQDEIESKLLKIEGLITSIGKNMHSGEWSLHSHRNW